MSQQLYTFEYRKPRLSNPTFISSNVCSSLSFYNPGRIAPHNTNSKPQPQPNSHGSFQVKTPIKESRSDLQLPKINNHGQRESMQMQKIDTKRQNYNHLGRYGQNIVDSSKQFKGPIPQHQNTYKRSMSIGQLYKSDPKLLPSLSIERSLINFNEKDIFIKQGHNYNIITYQPKQHNEHIKKYPKLSLQQKDQFYRLKYSNDPKFANGSQDYRSNQNPENQGYDGSSSKNQSEKSKRTQGQKLAGLPTFKIEGGRKNATPITQLQHGNQYISQGLDAPNTKIQPSKTKFNTKPSKFDMKLLNSMDEFNYYA